MTPKERVVHQCPPEGSGTTPCCNHTPFELPRTDMMTLDPGSVTCWGASTAKRLLREELADRWEKEGRDDLAPHQRVAKWLRGK